MKKRLVNVVCFVLTLIAVIVLSALINRIPHTAAQDAIWDPITRPLELFMRLPSLFLWSR
jgi:membrane protease YdiL (CAAX protease family)